MNITVNKEPNSTIVSLHEYMCVCVCMGVCERARRERQGVMICIYHRSMLFHMRYVLTQKITERMFYFQLSSCMIYLQLLNWFCGLRWSNSLIDLEVWDKVQTVIPGLQKNYISIAGQNPVNDPFLDSQTSESQELFGR